MASSRIFSSIFSILIFFNKIIFLLFSINFFLLFINLKKKYSFKEWFKKKEIELDEYEEDNNFDNESNIEYNFENDLNKIAKDLNQSNINYYNNKDNHKNFYKNKKLFIFFHLQ